MTDYWDQIYYGEAIHHAKDGGLSDPDSALSGRLQEVEAHLGAAFAHQLRMELQSILRNIAKEEFRAGTRLGVQMMVELL